MKDYEYRLRDHLEQYKNDTLQVHEDGIFKGDRNTRPHILPEPKKELNILEPYRKKFWTYWNAKYGEQGKEPHPDFHHLNSSQAMCFNLFFPFIEEKARRRILTSEILAIGDEDFDDNHTAFEKVLFRETGEKTSFDFFLQLLPSRRRVFFELKLKEAEFAKADPTKERYIRQFRDVYGKHDLSRQFRAEYCTLEGFCGDYQICRNIWHLSPDNDDRLFFIFPKANKALNRDALELIAGNIASAELLPRIRVLFLEDVIGAIVNATQEQSRFRQHFEQFRKKYIIEYDPV